MGFRNFDKALFFVKCLCRLNRSLLHVNTKNKTNQRGYAHDQRLQIIMCRIACAAAGIATCALILNRPRLIVLKHGCYCLIIFFA